METFSALLAICAGNSPIPSEFPAQRLVTRSFDVFCDLRLNKRLSKQSWGWWFVTLLRPLWRQYNARLSTTVFLTKFVSIFALTWPLESKLLSSDIRNAIHLQKWTYVSEYENVFDVIITLLLCSASTGVTAYVNYHPIQGMKTNQHRTVIWSHGDLTICNLTYQENCNLEFYEPSYRVHRKNYTHVCALLCLVWFW